LNLVALVGFYRRNVPFLVPLHREKSPPKGRFSKRALDSYRAFRCQALVLGFNGLILLKKYGDFAAASKSPRESTANPSPSSQPAASQAR
jgi:hypothetical protein